MQESVHVKHKWVGECNKNRIFCREYFKELIKVFFILECLKLFLIYMKWVKLTPGSFATINDEDVWCSISEFEPIIPAPVHPIKVLICNLFRIPSMIFVMFSGDCWDRKMTPKSHDVEKSLVNSSRVVLTSVDVEMRFWNSIRFDDSLLL